MMRATGKPVALFIYISLLPSERWVCSIRLVMRMLS